MMRRQYGLEISNGAKTSQSGLQAWSKADLTQFFVGFLFIQDATQNIKLVKPHASILMLQ
jgi:hypothetical protein